MATSPEEHYTFVLLGASGDLAKKKIYPTLWSIFQQDKFHPNTSIVGFARSKMNQKQLIEKVEPFLKLTEEQKPLAQKFFSINAYVSADGYGDLSSYKKLDDEILKHEKAANGNRVFYLALPPSVFKVNNNDNNNNNKQQQQNNNNNKNNNTNTNNNKQKQQHQQQQTNKQTTTTKQQQQQQQTPTTTPTTTPTPTPTTNNNKQTTNKQTNKQTANNNHDKNSSCCYLLITCCYLLLLGSDTEY